jgi:hypothetical protein
LRLIVRQAAQTLVRFAAARKLDRGVPRRGFDAPGSPRAPVTVLRGTHLSLVRKTMSEPRGISTSIRRVLLLAGFGALVASVPGLAASSAAEMVTIDSDTFWPEDDYTFDALTIRNEATLTVAGGSTLRVTGELEVSEESALVVQGKNVDSMVDGEWRGEGVTVEAADVTVEAGSVISTDQQGYSGGAGPGAGGSDGGAHGGSGGGYGGVGGSAGDSFFAGGPTYGAVFAPVDLGSGGGPTSTAAGNGGGAITLVVTGVLTLDGVITANGGNSAAGNCFSAPAAGGGAGGSIFITTATLAGSGRLTANGGNGADGGCIPGVQDDGGGGAGGRIAVFYLVSDAFGGFTTSSVSGGTGGGHVGGAGTMVFVDTANDALRVSQNLELPPDSFISFGAVKVDDAATLTLGGGSTLTVEDDFTVTGSSIVIALSKDATNLVDGEWQGTGVTIRAHDVQVEAGSVISADEQGYPQGTGPGAGGSDGGAHGGAGGGYGGVGGLAGDGFFAGGPTYGAVFAPVDLGSGGGPTSTAAGNGGGANTLVVTGTLTLDGMITVNGGDATPGNCFSAPAGGGGAGGSIFITVSTLSPEPVHWPQTAATALTAAASLQSSTTAAAEPADGSPCCTTPTLASPASRPRALRAAVEAATWARPELWSSSTERQTRCASRRISSSRRILPSALER